MHFFSLVLQAFWNNWLERGASPNYVVETSGVPTHRHKFPFFFLLKKKPKNLQKLPQLPTIWKGALDFSTSIFRTSSNSKYSYGLSKQNHRIWKKKTLIPSHKYEMFEPTPTHVNSHLYTISSCSCSGSKNQTQLWLDSR
jgi:hypothetical protein